MIRSVTMALILFVASAAPLLAQTPAPDAPPEQSAGPAPRTMVGSWEFSNADREKICSITFRNEAAKVGKRVEFDAPCVNNFAFIRSIVGWQMDDNDFLRLLDAQGNSILEFSEVESGIFEAPKVGEGILFIQNPTDLGPAPKTAADITGEWSVTRRNGRPICGLTLADTAAGDEFAVRLQPAATRWSAALRPPLGRWTAARSCCTRLAARLGGSRKPTVAVGKESRRQPTHCT
jgi:hypothetical protein